MHFSCDFRSGKREEVRTGKATINWRGVGVLFLYRDKNSWAWTGERRVDRLRPHAGWTTLPWATIIAPISKSDEKKSRKLPPLQAAPADTDEWTRLDAKLLRHCLHATNTFSQSPPCKLSHLHHVDSNHTNYPCAVFSRAVVSRAGHSLAFSWNKKTP